MVYHRSIVKKFYLWQNLKIFYRLKSIHSDSNFFTIWLKSDLYLQYRIEDLISKVRPLFTISNRGSDHSPLLIVSSGDNIDRSKNLDFYVTEGISEALTVDLSTKVTFIIFKNTALCLKYAIWLVEIMMQYANYKVHTKFTWTPSVMGSYQILYGIE